MKDVYYDISMEISADMTVYKNRMENEPKIDTYLSHPTKGMQQSAICMDLHTGTHIDMPLHVIEKGADSTGYPLQKTCGTCRVLDLTEGADAVNSDMLMQKEVKAGEIILLKTKNSFSDSFLADFSYLTESGAVFLAGAGVRAVGTDGLGIERGQPGHPTHKILLESGIPIIEGLRLADVPEGSYELCCLPLRIAGVEGLPARAVLLSL